ncbi:MAG: aspartyl/asparaginyl beta-hydroxylase domain-containing protein [Pseudomonadota bacterium]
MAGLARFLLHKFGYPIRYRVNRFVIRYSRLPDLRTFPADMFDWTDLSKADWQTIRDEFQERSVGDASFRSISELSPDHEGLNPEGRWHSAVLHGYGIRVDQNCARYPKTAAIVEKIPGLYSAMFSVQQPGCELPSHVGVTKGVLTCHLSLDVPDGDCAILVEGERHDWREGDWFIFDDTRRHEAWNRTADRRINLLVHVKRPLRGPGRWLQAVFDYVIVRSPFVQDFYDGVVKHAERSTELPPTPANEPALTAR